MNRKFEFAVIQLADERRDERINAALAIFSENNVDVRIPRRLDKLRALSAAVNLESVRESIQRISDLDAIGRGQGLTSACDRIAMLSKFSPMKFGPVSDFMAISVASYEEWIERLTRTLVEPEPARARVSAKRSKLVSLVRSALRSERVLALPGEDLSAHRVLSNVQIVEGLSADFLLKNGSMHVIETVDASNEDFSVRKVVSDIAVAALVLEQARMVFGETKTVSRIIYDASSAAEKIAQPSLDAAAHQGAELINWASQDDRRSLIYNLASLATPHAKGSANKEANLHASLQGKLSIN